MLQKHTIVWKPLEYQGIEYLTIRDDENRVEVQSVVIGVEQQGAYRLDYSIRYDAAFGVREVNMTVAGKGKLHHSTDGSGNWFDSEHNPLHEFNGCLDIDISATPFTNTLPIRRIAWQTGQSETLKMVYIAIPDLTVTVEPQRYTCIQQTASGAVFRFEHLSSGFTAVLPIEADGLVLDYPGLFERVWAG